MKHFSKKSCIANILFNNIRKWEYLQIENQFLKVDILRSYYISSGVMRGVL